MIKFHFSKENVIILVAGIVLVTVAYVFMARGDITISPILLTIAYVIIFPAAILFKPKKKDVKNKND